MVTHPAAASYAREASRNSGVAAARAEQEKLREFRALGSGAGFDFVPFALESFGRLGRDASRFLSELGSAAEANGRVSKAAFVRSVRQELSCALCRGNSRMYSDSVFTLARAAGRQFMDGCEVPVDDFAEE